MRNIKDKDKKSIANTIDPLTASRQITKTYQKDLNKTPQITNNTTSMTLCKEITQLNLLTDPTATPSNNLTNTTKQ